MKRSTAIARNSVTLILMAGLAAVVAVAAGCGSGTTSEPTPTIVNRLTPRAGGPGAFPPTGLRPGGTPPAGFPGMFQGTPPAGGFPGRAGFNTPIAEFLGITEDQLASALQEDGATLASVAASYGKSRDELEQFLIDDARDRLAGEVKAGTITQEQADQQVTMLENVIGRLLDGSGGPPMNGTPPTQ